MLFDYLGIPKRINTFYNYYKNGVLMTEFLFADKIFNFFTSIVIDSLGIGVQFKNFMLNEIYLNFYTVKDALRELRRSVTALEILERKMEHGLKQCELPNIYYRNERYEQT